MTCSDRSRSGTAPTNDQGASRLGLESRSLTQPDGWGSPTGCGRGRRLTQQLVEAGTFKKARTREEAKLLPLRCPIQPTSRA